MSVKVKVLTAVLFVSVFCLGLSGGYFGAYFMSNRNISSNKDISTDEGGKDVQEEEGKKKIDFTDIVTDAFSKVVPYEYGEYSYKIPELNYDGNGVDEFNKKMYDELYALYTESEKESVNLGGEPELAEIKYTWYHTDDVISIVAETRKTMYHDPQFYIYNFSLSEEKELLKTDIIENEGYTEESFNRKVRDAVQKETDNVLEKNYLRSGVDTSQSYSEAIESTLSDERVNQAVPFYNDKDELCVVTYVFSLGGAGMYRHMINLETGTDACDFDCGNK